MFTGIITHLGKIKQKSEALVEISASNSLLCELDKGTSIAVNGICLTVLEKPADTYFSVGVMPETLKRTMLHNLEENQLVNLELPITAATFLSGHIVQGHVDSIGKIRNITKEGNSRILTIEISQQISKYIVEKGSIAINGISLTVIESSLTSFTIGIIPYTWKHTMLQQIKVGDEVNLETDILAKYMEKLLQNSINKLRKN